MALMGVLSLSYVAHISMSFQTGVSTVLVSQATHAVSLQKPISASHLFGIYDDNTQNVPMTRLPLSLQGIMLAPNEQKNSYAIISTSSVPSKVYKPGDHLPQDAMLKSIREEDVLIQYQGQLQRLALPIKSLGSAPDQNG